MNAVYLLKNNAVQVLELESTNVKALYRRTQAYIELADLELAELDVKKALEIDPDNRWSSSSSEHVKYHHISIICDSLLLFSSQGCEDGV